MKIYLDNCCLNRPFDDQSFLRIHLEAEAIKTIIILIEERKLHLISSDFLTFEINKTPDVLRKQNLMKIISLASNVIQVNSKKQIRAKFFESFGVQAFDAIHLACAENNADVLLTVDDDFIKKSSNIENLNIKVLNPLKWLEKVLS